MELEGETEISARNRTNCNSEPYEPVVSKRYLRGKKPGVNDPVLEYSEEVESRLGATKEETDRVFDQIKYKASEY